MKTVHGRLVDAHTRCAHWHGPTDVIAIRFRCCDRFYACYECHAEAEQHEPQRWTPDELDTPGILCGMCGGVLSIAAYLSSGYACPSCGAAFNPRCALHHHLYFDAG